jgi:hypothetical protein
MVLSFCERSGEELIADRLQVELHIVELELGEII